MYIRASWTGSLTAKGSDGSTVRPREDGSMSLVILLEDRAVAIRDTTEDNLKVLHENIVKEKDRGETKVSRPVAYWICLSIYIRDQKLFTD